MERIVFTMNHEITERFSSNRMFDSHVLVAIKHISMYLDQVGNIGSEESHAAQVNQMGQLEASWRAWGD